MMTLFQKHKTSTAYAKIGIMGFAGAGKTYTATQIAIGAHKLLVDAKLAEQDTPVNFLDTETGSDWVAEQFGEAGIELHSAKTRSFADLLTAVRESRHILLIDSITHFWKELCSSYKTRRRKKFMAFADWANVKDMWYEFSDWFVNSPCHVIMCGRAGYVYDMFQDEDKQWQVRTSGVKMQTEKETGYEPSLLVRMDLRQVDTDSAIGYQFRHTAVVLKDRADVLDGKTCDDPGFSFFLPHFHKIGLGIKHMGVDTTRTSESIIEEPDSNGNLSSGRREALCDDIQATLVKHYPGQTKDEKQTKILLLEKHFGRPGWTGVTQLGENELKEGLGTLLAELEPESSPATTDQQAAEVF